jgi:hypothetical protein
MIVYLVIFYYLSSYQKQGLAKIPDSRFTALILSLSFITITGTGGAVCKGATPSVEQPGGRGFKPRLRSLLD